jgi:hypothetical protein
VSFARKLRRRNAGRRAEVELRIYELDISATTEELECAVRRLGPDVLRTNKPFYMAVAGFDENRRELREIPEVSALMQRVIDSGFFGLLGDDAAIPDLQGALIDMHRCFALAKGAMRTNRRSGQGEFWITPEFAEEFLEALGNANRKVDRLLGWRHAQ